MAAPPSSAFCFLGRPRAMTLVYSPPIARTDGASSTLYPARLGVRNKLSTSRSREAVYSIGDLVSRARDPLPRGFDAARVPDGAAAGTQVLNLTPAYGFERIPCILYTPTESEAESQPRGGVPHRSEQRSSRTMMLAEFRKRWRPRPVRCRPRRHDWNSALSGMTPKPAAIDASMGSPFLLRWLTLGQTRSGKLLVVAHTYQQTDMQETAVRIISARSATRHERRQYEETHETGV